MRSEEELVEDSGGHEKAVEKATAGAKQSRRWSLDKKGVGQGSIFAKAALSI